MKQWWRLESWRPRLELISQPPVIAAFIVFATFVVKDAIRDYIKDKLDIVNSAEVSFTTRNDTFTTWAALAVIEGQLTTIAWASTHGSNQTENPKTEDTQWVNLEQLIIVKEFSELAEIDELADKLPATVRGSIRTKSAAVGKDLDAIEKRIVGPNRDDKAFDDLGPLGIRVSKLNDQVFPEFEKEKDSLQHLYDVTVRMSYIFSPMDGGKG